VNEGITSQNVRDVGSALALFIGEGKTIAIGKDPRISSPCWKMRSLKVLLDMEAMR